jgi:uncharacterized protein YlxW (UPF0749 family)
MQTGRIAVGFTALVLGLMVAVQFRLQRVVPPPTATNQLLVLLQHADQERNQLASQVTRVNALLNRKLSAEASAKALERRLVQQEILAGTIPVTGPGIRIDWSNGSAPSGYKIDDIALLLLVNELRAAGAEAIAVNGQRITADTEIRQASNYILINSSQQDPPFTITAIGDASTLTDALNLPGGLFDQSQQEGQVMTIVSQSSLIIPAAPPLLVQYAQATNPSNASKTAGGG